MIKRRDSGYRKKCQQICLILEMINIKRQKNDVSIYK